jgi:hypothetical protein
MKLRVAKDNMNYTAKDDILYSKDMTKFICCPEMKYFFSFLPSVTIIGEKAFYMCRNLDKITIPDYVTEIGDNAFANSWIKSVDILSNNVKINGNIFADAVHLKEIKVAENNINYVVKDGVLYSKDMSKIICAEKNIETCSVPNGVIEICPYAFDKCYKLTNIEIPSTVTVIDDYAFRNCIRLTNIVIPNSVTKIGEKAFFRCRRLEEIDIPNSVTSIGDNAFSGCSKLNTAVIFCASPYFFRSNRQFSVPCTCCTINCMCYCRRWRIDNNFAYRFCAKWTGWFPAGFKEHSDSAYIHTVWNFILHK